MRTEVDGRHKKLECLGRDRLEREGTKVIEHWDAVAITTA